MAAFLVTMLLPTGAGYLVFQDVARRSSRVETTYAIRDLGIHLGEAAQAIDEFGNLAQRSIAFFQTGEHFSLRRLDSALADSRAAIEELLHLTEGTDHDLLLTIQRDLEAYSRRVRELPPLLLERGIQDYGVAGQMRAAVHALEDELTTPALQVHLLTLRRHEKDYIIRDLDRYIEEHKVRAAMLRSDLAACADCGDSTVQQRLQKLDDYTATFGELVALDRRIGLRGGTGIYSEIQSLETRLFDDHRLLMESVSAATAGLVDDARQRLATIVGAVGLLAILVSGLLARRLTRPLSTLSGSINRYVASRFTADVEVDTREDSTDEIAQIARDFRAMQGAIRHHLADLEAQQATLLTLNEHLEGERRNLSMAQRMAGMGYWQCRTDSGDFETSPELLQMLGYPPDQCFNCRGFADAVIHPDSRDDFDRDLAVCRRTGQPVERVYRAVSPLTGDLWIRQFIRSESSHDDGSTLLVAAVQDVSRQRQSEEEIRRLAYFDALTGLPQRGYLFQRLEEMVRTARRRDERFALFFIDLDKFKEINDSLGHEAGDQLLICVADRLRGAARDSDFVARLAGDEFCMLLDNICSEVDVADIAQRLLDTISQPVEISARTLAPMASMGIAMYPEDGDNAEAIMIAADNAMYTSKRRGDHGFVLHEHQISEEANQRLRMSRELRQALREEEFELHYQPQIAPTTGEIRGWEALLRWRHPERGLLTAAGFIDDIERIGLISELGQWVINRACRQLSQWRGSGLPETRVSINIAPRHMAQGRVPDQLADAMSRHGVGPGELEVEITEAGIQSGEDIRHATEAIRALGVAIAIDDFGTGYSSLASLRTLTIDSLKIDRTFVQHAASNANDCRLLSSIIELAGAFDYRIVAEGVETQEQLDLLRALGVHLVQGFMFSRAVPPEKVGEMMNRALTNGMTGSVGSPATHL